MVGLEFYVSSDQDPNVLLAGLDAAQATGLQWWLVLK